MCSSGEENVRSPDFTYCCFMPPVNSKCKQCSSSRLDGFVTEIALHFPGLDGLYKPIVWVFPSISVWLDCGLAQFAISEKELEVLRTGVPVEGAAVWLGRSKE